MNPPGPTLLLPFWKAEANGNDFLIVNADDLDAAGLAQATWPELTRQICDRHTGVGADGVEFVRISALADGIAEIGLTLLNADGGEAEISGNGTRCVFAWAVEQQGIERARITTRAGLKQARALSGRGRAAGASVLGQAMDVEIGMGHPEFASERIPMRLETGSQDSVRGATLEAAGRPWRVTALSMGNPQCLLLLNAIPADWREVGAALESHPAFPQRTNVEFVHVLDRHTIEIVIFERGVGPTQSSGTGSCASAVAAIVNGLADSPVRVLTPGGEQEVEWSGGEVFLRGPARVVAAGQYRWSGMEGKA